jgi:hypothetical protein
MSNISGNFNLVHRTAETLSNSKGLETDRIHFNDIGNQSICDLAIRREDSTNCFTNLFWSVMDLGDGNSVLLNRNSAIKRLGALGIDANRVKTALETHQMQQIHDLIVERKDQCNQNVEAQIRDHAPAGILPNLLDGIVQRFANLSMEEYVQLYRQNQLQPRVDTALEALQPAQPKADTTQLEVDINRYLKESSPQLDEDTRANLAKNLCTAFLSNPSTAPLENRLLHYNAQITASMLPKGWYKNETGVEVLTYALDHNSYIHVAYSEDLTHKDQYYQMPFFSIEEMAEIEGYCIQWSEEDKELRELATGKRTENRPKADYFFTLPKTNGSTNNQWVDHFYDGTEYVTLASLATTDARGYYTYDIIVENQFRSIPISAVEAELDAEKADRAHLNELTLPWIPPNSLGYKINIVLSSSNISQTYFIPAPQYSET